jgi:transcriptional regulator with XRE-family HTH domain
MRVSPLRRLRLCLGLRLHDVERAIRIPSSGISRLERGEATLNEPRLQRLAGFYGLSSEDLARAMAAWATHHGPRTLAPVVPPPERLDDAGDLGPPAA